MSIISEALEELKKIDECDKIEDEPLQEDAGTEIMGAAAAGASIGATLGSVLPGIGTALGTLGGAAVGAATSAISKIVAAIKKGKAKHKSEKELLNDPELQKNIKKLETAVGEKKTDSVTDLIDKELDVDLKPMVESLRQNKIN